MNEQFLQQIREVLREEISHHFEVSNYFLGLWSPLCVSVSEAASRLGRSRAFVNNLIAANLLETIDGKVTTKSLIEYVHKDKNIIQDLKTKVKKEEFSRHMERIKC